MNVALLGAGGLSLLWALVHFFGGRQTIVVPLLAATDLPDVARYTMYYCWHIASMVLLVMAGGFAYAGWSGGAVELAWALTGLAGGFSLWGVALVPWKGQRVAELPQGLLFVPITFLGVWGLLA